ncbi:unnamed protein product [Knipowitschia caucasica]
MSWTSDKMN